MRLSVIVAYDAQYLIGRKGALPWRLPRDLARFKDLTMGRPIIMGRRTFESIGRPLPGRLNIVLTRGADLADTGDVIVAGDLEAALKAAESAGAEEAFVVGGESVYREALPVCERIYATEVEARLEGDAWFPRIDPDSWRVLEEEHVPADDRNEHSFTFKIYERR